MATAFAALVSLQNNLRLIYNHPRHSFSFENEQIYSLWESVCFLIEFMESFDDSHGATKEAAEALEGRIVRAVQAAEDVIESHVVDQIHDGSTLGGSPRSRYLLDLQKAIEDVDFVRRKAIHVQKSWIGLKAEQPTFSAATTASSTPFASERMVGFHSQLLQLLDLLTGESSRRRVIAIVGMGGIGKTTLASNAFQHPFIGYKFDVCLWATISQEFNIQKILTHLLSQVKEKASLLSKISNSVDTYELGEELHRSLYARRYLIIFDDMWSTEAWDKMKLFFPDRSNNIGSCIVVTTRQSDVAHHLGSSSLDMSLLDAGSSWDLFCEKTFEGDSCPPELEDIGKRIVEKCKGLPLAIVVVGGHLRKSSRMTEYWDNVANNMSSVLSSRENEGCFNILSLSYRHLPVRLKPCFLFFGVFQEDQEIPVSELLNLWIGEGFIEEYVNCSLEDTARSYLVDLTERNLISTYEVWVGRDTMVCRIHDLLRELCLKIAKKDEFFSVVDTRRAINKDRRVVIKGTIPNLANHQPDIFLAPRSTPLIRSLVCEGGQLSFDLKLLRLLNKVERNEISFPQINLRYLKVDLFHKSYIPSSISLLWNLQTLIINVAFGSIIAPYEIWEMLQLRHIDINPLCLLDPLPLPTLEEDNALVLKHLHTLSKVQNFRLSDEVCKRIPNIKELDVSYCDEESSYYCLHNLECFQKLESLGCYFDFNRKWHDFPISLTYPNSLKRLRLSGCRLCWEELTMKVGFLPHLEILELLLDSVTGSEWTLVEGAFPRLKDLLIDRCDLIYWNVEDFHFPVLEFVSLCMPKLDEFPLGIGEIPTLRKISLAYCSMSAIFSAMRMVVEQSEQGNEGLHLDVHLKDDEELLEGFKQEVEKEGLTSNSIHLNLHMLKRKCL